MEGVATGAPFTNQKAQFFFFFFFLREKYPSSSLQVAFGYNFFWVALLQNLQLNSIKMLVNGVLIVGTLDL